MDNKRLFHIYVDNDSILSDIINPRKEGRHNTTTQIPKVTKAILPIGANLKTILDELNQMNALRFAAKESLYKLYMQDTSGGEKKFIQVDALQSATNLYFLVLDENLRVGDDLKTLIRNYDGIDKLKNKLDSQMLTIAGLVFDIREAQKAFGFA